MHVHTHLTENPFLKHELQHLILQDLTDFKNISHLDSKNVIRTFKILRFVLKHINEKLQRLCFMIYI